MCGSLVELPRPPGWLSVCLVCLSRIWIATGAHSQSYGFIELPRPPRRALPRSSRAPATPPGAFVKQALNSVWIVQTASDLIVVRSHHLCCSATASSNRMRPPRIEASWVMYHRITFVVRDPKRPHSRVVEAVCKHRAAVMVSFCALWQRQPLRVDAALKKHSARARNPRVSQSVCLLLCLMVCFPRQAFPRQAFQAGALMD